MTCWVVNIGQESIMEPQKTRPKLNGRHKKILEQLREEGFLATEQMARDLAVTTQTILRDRKSVG